MAEKNLPIDPEGLVQKIPTHDEYKKSPKTTVQYVFMLLFVILFTYFLWGREDDCAEKVAILERSFDRERAVWEKRDSINNARMSALETAVMVKSRALEEIGTKVGVKPEDMNNVISTTGGGSQ